MKTLGAFILFIVFCLLILRTPNDTRLPTGILLEETPTLMVATLVPLLGVTGQGIETVGQVAQDASEYGICSGPFVVALALVVGVFAVNCLRTDEG